MASSTVENYIKQIYLLQSDKGQGGQVSMGELATSLAVAPGTATSMVKSLARTEHVSYVPRVGVGLTDRGRTLALRVLRRHRLIELFLVKTLGMEWHEIHEEAEALEHVISDRVLERIDSMLGHPELDPHGDPIPSSAGLIAKRDLFPLDQCVEGQAVIIGWIEDQQDSFLQFLESNQLLPGKRLQVSVLDLQAGVLAVKLKGGAICRLGMPAARKIHVELCG